MPETSHPAWRLRLDAVLNAHAGLPSARYAQFATVRPDGRPANRTVVVRGLLDPLGRPLVTTDARSAKAGQLADSPWAELCWWFPETREQFRLLGLVTQVGPGEDNAELSAARARVWADLPEASRRSFTWPAPGSLLAGAEWFEGPSPVKPPNCFTLLVLDPEAVEHLDLKPAPHERTRYQRESGIWLTARVNP